MPPRITNECGSSATKSGNAPVRILSMSLQIPHSRGASAWGSSAWLMGALRRQLDETDAGIFQQFGDGVKLVGLFVEDRADTGVDQHLEALDTRRMRDVDVRVADRGAIFCRLRDRVHFGVNRAIAVLLDFAVGRARFVDQTADSGLDTVRQ